ncbi:MAG: hypothetical protein GXY24_07900 [Bacteroidales bacterium]|jgi:hypothetical protein|nr:hypothetical protein [Bacteroidales bacterium]
MVNPIDIHTLTLEELSGVISLYPWYGGARMELCRRMSELGALSESQISETGLHLGDRGILSELLHADRAVDCSDKDVRELMQAFIPDEPAARASRKVYVVGGDYFSQDQYEDVRSDGDGIFSKFAAKAREEGYTEEEAPETGKERFCTETLAGIYLEQGFPQEAIDIYSRLSLRYPEKSVYFAALIEEINKKDN